MIEFYPYVKLAHIVCVALSGGLFTLRGLLMLCGSGYANHAALRWLSYAIDTTLLTAALMLSAMLRQYPFAQAWLTVKVVLLLVYIALGIFALRRGPTLRVRAWCFAAAVAVFLFIVTVARSHDPAGAFRALIVLMG